MRFPWTRFAIGRLMYSFLSGASRTNTAQKQKKIKKEAMPCRDSAIVNGLNGAFSLIRPMADGNTTNSAAAADARANRAGARWCWNAAAMKAKEALRR